MSLKRFVDVATVSSLLKKGVINREGVRLLDCSYTLAPKPDWQNFEKEFYGKFELLHQRSMSRQVYLSGHIPEAVHLSLDAAMYPSKNERFALYSPEMFEKYVQFLGIDKDEHLIFYGRNPLWGMVFPAKVAWLFKTYGHSKVSIIDGGFDKWTGENLDVSTEEVKLNKKGTWTASDNFFNLNIRYEELEKKDENGNGAMFDRTNEINFLDTRIRGQFEGKQNTTLDPKRVKGSFVPGFKNCPSIEMLNEDNTLRSNEDIHKWLLSNGLMPGKPIVTSCNIGMQASLMSYVLEGLIKDSNPKLFNGSLKEIEIRSPHRICEGNMNPAE